MPCAAGERTRAPSRSPVMRSAPPGGQTLCHVDGIGVCRRSSTTGKETTMKCAQCVALAVGAVLPFLTYGVQAAEVKGAAILDTPCGKVAVKQMGLLHDGKFDEANKLSTKEMQDQWKAMPAKDRAMMSDMSKEMSQTEAQYAADIKASGVLVVNGPAATLTVKKTTKDANGSSSSTTRQEFRLNGNECLVSR